MDETGAHFVVLPERREDLWRSMLVFLGTWRGVPAGGHGLDGATLDGVESALGFALPQALREFYRAFGGLIDAGYFDDGCNALLPPDQCRLVGDRGVTPGVQTLAIADEYFGALWGIRSDQLALADPPLRCIDTGGWPTDDLFSLTEFLVGLLFRATVVNAPLHIRVESRLSAAGQHDTAWTIHEQLLAHFPTWDRGRGEKDCGFLSHIEGDDVIAVMTADGLDLGLPGEAALSRLPAPLPDLLAELVDRPGH